VPISGGYATKVGLNGTLAKNNAQNGWVVNYTKSIEVINFNRKNILI